MRPSINQYFMNIAEKVSTRATCLRREVGAIIVKGKQIVSTGYNGIPTGLEHCSNCMREELKIPSGERSELCRGAHAEQNAINFAAKFGISIEGAIIYSTIFPCSWCAKSIVNAGIIKVVYDGNYNDELSREILQNIIVEKL